MVFQQRKLPEEIPEYTFTASHAEDEVYRIDIAPTLVKEGIVKSNSELKRLLAQGAIELDGNKISSNIIDAHNGSVLKVGKRDFVKIAIELSLGGL
jgi:tyrosyl-tRNA synthetase